MNQDTKTPEHAKRMHKSFTPNLIEMKIVRWHPLVPAVDYKIFWLQEGTHTQNLKTTAWKAGLEKKNPLAYSCMIAPKSLYSQST